MRLVIIGPSGSGKGTQADLLENGFGWRHISMGDLFRKEISRNTNLGKKIAGYVDKGLWAPTKLTIAVLDPILRKSLKKGFVLDGFPRVPDQPGLLDKALEQMGAALDLVIHFKIRPEVILARRKKVISQGRSFYPNQKRNDESERAILNRFKSYQKTIKPILSYYRRRGLLVEIDAERPIRLIYKDVLRAIKKIKQ